MNLHKKSEGNPGRLEAMGAKPESGTSTFAGPCASEVLGSVTPVGTEDGVPFDNMDTKDTDVLRIMVVLGNGQAGLRSSLPQKATVSIAQFNSAFTTMSTARAANWRSWKTMYNKKTMM